MCVVVSVRQGGEEMGASGVRVCVCMCLCEALAYSIAGWLYARLEKSKAGILETRKALLPC